MKKQLLNCYKNFKCTAENCPDTCCAGWTISIDDKTVQKYFNVKSDFSEELKNNLELTKNGYVTKQKCERCAFLDEKNLCKIYTNLGESALSEVCFNHPRFINDFGGVLEVCFSLSCPEAVRLLIEENSLEVLSEYADFAVTPNDIDHDFYFQLKAERDKIFEIIKSDSDFKNKLIKIFQFSGEKSPKNPLKNYAKFLKKLNKCDYTRKPLKDAIKLLYYSKDFKIFPLDTKTASILNNLIVAYVFRFYLTAVFGEDKSKIIKFILSSIYTILLLSKTLPISDAIRLYSRDVIHSDKNLKKLKKIL